MQPTVSQKIIQKNKNGVDTPNERLWGAIGRVITGVMQIISGLALVVFAIFLIIEPSGESPILAKIGFGIWCGVFCGVTGVIGVFSQRSKKLVSAYLKTSLFLLFLCVVCVFAFFVGLLIDSMTLFGSPSRAESHRQLYGVSIGVVAFGGIVSIIGASFTCGVLCSKKRTEIHHVMVYTSPHSVASITNPEPVLPSAPPIPDDFYINSLYTP